jgi:hypothetical protein
MSPIDVEAHLEKNPQVDEDTVRKRLEKIRREGAGRPGRGAGNISPYAGKRMIIDERSEVDEGAPTRSRSSYGRA